MNGGAVVVADFDVAACPDEVDAFSDFSDFDDAADAADAGDTLVTDPPAAERTAAITAAA